LAFVIYKIFGLEFSCPRSLFHTLADYLSFYLWVLEGNNRARQFYEKNGFYFDGTIREREYGKLLVQLKYVLRL